MNNILQRSISVSLILANTVAPTLAQSGRCQDATPFRAQALTARLAQAYASAGSVSINSREALGRARQTERLHAVIRQASPNLRAALEGSLDERDGRIGLSDLWRRLAGDYSALAGWLLRCCGITMTVDEDGNPSFGGDTSWLFHNRLRRDVGMGAAQMDRSFHDPRLAPFLRFVLDLRAPFLNVIESERLPSAPGLIAEFDRLENVWKSLKDAQLRETLLAVGRCVVDPLKKVLIRSVSSPSYLHQNERQLLAECKKVADSLSAVAAALRVWPAGKPLPRKELGLDFGALHAAGTKSFSPNGPRFLFHYEERDRLLRSILVDLRRMIENPKTRFGELYDSLQDDLSPENEELLNDALWRLVRAHAKALHTLTDRRAVGCLVACALRLIESLDEGFVDPTLYREFRITFELYNSKRPSDGPRLAALSLPSAIAFALSGFHSRRHPGEIGDYRAFADALILLPHPLAAQTIGLALTQLAWRKKEWIEKRGRSFNAEAERFDAHALERLLPSAYRVWSALPKTVSNHRRVGPFVQQAIASALLYHRNPSLREVVREYGTGRTLTWIGRIARDPAARRIARLGFEFGVDPFRYALSMPLETLLIRAAADEDPAWRDLMARHDERDDDVEKRCLDAIAWLPYGPGRKSAYRRFLQNAA